MKEIFPISVITLYSEGWTMPLGIGFWDGCEYRDFIRKEADQDIVWEFLSLLGKMQDSLGKKKPEWIISSHTSDGLVTKFILDSLRRHKESLQPLAAIDTVKWLDKNIIFTDRHHLLPMSLKIICKAFGVDTPLDYSIREGTYSFRAVLKKDCLDLVKVLDSYTSRLQEKWEVTPSLTLANTSMKIFNKNYFPTKKIHSNGNWEVEIRKATFGGRNEIYRDYGENINCYDVSSMFMSCYNTPVPIGKMLRSSPDLDTGTLAYAKVKVPTSLELGPLPYDFHGHLIFPVGEFEGWWDNTDLRNAVKPEWGCDVTILKQLKADESPILEQFGEDFLNLRYTEKSMDKIWKQHGVVLYGKFGQKRHPTEVMHESQIPWNKLTNCVPVPDTEETFYLVASKRENLSKKPAISMRIRAEARSRHSNLLLEASKSGEIFYCDTDSIFTTTQMTTHKGPGMLHLVYNSPAWRGYFIRQKFYALIFPGGKLISKTSGYAGPNLREDYFQSMLEGENIPLSDYRDPSMKQILAYKPLERRLRDTSIKKTLSPGRLITGTSTRPVQLPEVQEEISKILETV